MAATAGVVLLLLSWGLLHVGFFADNQIIDTPTYQRYGEAMLDGRVPYRDFAVEYPPGALPAFLLPALAGEGGFRDAFEWIMFACSAAAIVAMALALGAVGASPARLFAATAFAGLAPLMLGSLVLTRFDYWPAALTVAALAALVAGRHRLGFGVLGAAVAAKIFPLVILPLALVFVSRRRGGREAWVCFAAFAAVLAAILVPFAAIAPDGVWDSVQRQTGRPLQIESFGAAFLIALDRLGSYSALVVSSFGSQNLDGAAPDALATMQTAVQAFAIVAVWVVFAVGRTTEQRLLTASAAAVSGFVAFGKVLSPQFLVWLVPLVLLTAGWAGVLAAALLAAALLLTQTWFPFRYWDLVGLGPEAWLVLARDLVLIALFVVLVAAIRPERGRPRMR